MRSDRAPVSWHFRRARKAEAPSSCWPTTSPPSNRRADRMKRAAIDDGQDRAGNLAQLMRHRAAHKRLAYLVAAASLASLLALSSHLRASAGAAAPASPAAGVLLSRPATGDEVALRGRLGLDRSLVEWIQRVRPGAGTAPAIGLPTVFSLLLAAAVVCLSRRLPPAHASVGSQAEPRGPPVTLV